MTRNQTLQALQSQREDGFRALRQQGWLKESIDAVEKIVEASHWPFPTYEDLLFSL